MKQINFILISLSILLISCNKKDFEEGIVKFDNPYLEVRITKVTTNKYSKVGGYVTYNEINYYVDNGNSGYYYKKYTLKPGDKIYSDVKFYYIRESNGDVRITTSNLDVSTYERK